MTGSVHPQQGRRSVRDCLMPGPGSHRVMTWAYTKVSVWVHLMLFNQINSGGDMSYNQINSGGFMSCTTVLYVDLCPSSIFSEDRPGTEPSSLVLTIEHRYIVLPLLYSPTSFLLKFFFLHIMPPEFAPSKFTKPEKKLKTLDGKRNKKKKNKKRVPFVRECSQRTTLGK
jgi:hypothetical protein